MKDRNNTAPYQEKLKELTKEIENKSVTESNRLELKIFTHSYTVKRRVLNR